MSGVRSGGALALGLVCVAAGCNSTHVGNPPADPGDPTVAAALSFQAVEGAEPSAGGVEVEAAWLVVRDLHLLPTGRCEGGEGGGSVRLEGPFVVELVSGQVWGEDGGAVLEGAPGAYCGLNFKVRSSEGMVLPEGAPPELAGQSLYVVATWGDGTRVEVLSSAPETLLLRSREGGLALPSDGALTAWIVGFDASSWWEGLEVEGGEGETVRISQTEDAAGLRSFRQAFKKSSRVYLDGDMSGGLSAAEEAAPLTEAGE